MAQDRDATLSAVEHEIGRNTYCLLNGQSPLRVLSIVRDILTTWEYRAAKPEVARSRYDANALYDWFVADGRPLFQVFNLGDNSKVTILAFSRRGAQPSTLELQALKQIRQQLSQAGIVACDQS